MGMAYVDKVCNECGLTEPHSDSQKDPFWIVIAGMWYHADCVSKEALIQELIDTRKKWIQGVPFRV